MTSPHCRYCGLLPMLEPGNGCKRHPKPMTQVERLERRVAALEEHISGLYQILEDHKIITPSKEESQELAKVFLEEA